MAITVLATPQDFTPAYNPMYFYFDSTNKAELGFRYLVEIVDSTSSEVIGTYKLKPIPTTLYGEVDISKIIQTVLFNDFQDLTVFKATGHQVEYELNIDEEYYVNEAFSDYGWAGTGVWSEVGNPIINPNGFARTQLIHATDPNFNAGDVILVAQTPSANYRPELEGIHTVLDVYLDTGVWYTVLDLLWIGSGAASAGVVSYADGQKTIVVGTSTASKMAFKGAFSFMDFKTYLGTDYELDGATKKLLTTLPDGVRISRTIPTYLSGNFANGLSRYVVFNIAGDLYRYGVGAIDDVLVFNALPSTAIITEEWDGGAWVAFVGTIDLSTVDTYTVQIQTSASVDESEEVTITLYNECDAYTTYDIMFLDRLGSWITIPFSKGSYMQQDVQRQEIRTKYGGLDTGDWVYTSLDKGQQTYHIEESLKYTVNTGILSEVESQYMRELIATPQAYVSIDGGELQAINIINTSQSLWLKRTQRDRKISLQFTMAVQDEING